MSPASRQEVGPAPPSDALGRSRLVGEAAVMFPVSGRVARIVRGPRLIDHPMLLWPCVVALHQPQILATHHATTRSALRRSVGPALSLSKDAGLAAEDAGLAAEDAGLAAEDAGLAAENARLRQQVVDLEQQIERTEGLCEVLDTGDWASSLQSRATWLLGLLVAQSCSSFILADNEQLLTSHPTVIFFMTMLVGAGGNAGNQASVRLIRGLATGEVNPDSGEQTRRILLNEARVGAALGLILVFAGFIRVAAFRASLVDAAAVSASLFLIVSISVVLGTLLPLLLNRLRLDAAHASTSIQVIMDVLGVLITCTVAPVVFQLALTSTATGAASMQLAATSLGS